MKVEQIEELRSGLQESFDLLIRKIGRVQIGTREQFPFGWRKAAKGRTVWRILEELITQTLEKYHSEFNLEYIKPSESEVSIFDFECKLKNNINPIYVNVKSAVKGGRSNKDDISKALSLKSFYDADLNRNFFTATFFIAFNDDMSFVVTDAIVFPVVWLPDIYVNPSNNGNLQSACFKDIFKAVKRSNKEFYPLLLDALFIAKKKKISKG